MRRNPGFEPSVRSVLNVVLPDEWKVVCGEEHLHLRVSYPLILRTTGLGRIEGGELVLVPTARVADVIVAAQALCDTGISGIVLFGAQSQAIVLEHLSCSAPVVVAEDQADPQVARERMDRYIVRRRRELFALEQRLHRLFVDAALAGEGTVELLRRAAEETGGLVLLDRGGEILLAPSDHAGPSAAELACARQALDRGNEGRASVAGPPRMLSLEVAGGGERKGLVAAFGLRDDHQEEDEAVMAALTSAVSIVLSRAPVVEIPTLETVMSQRTASRSSEPAPFDGRWSALALPGDTLAPETLQRVASSEADGRSAQYVLAQLEGAYVVLRPDVSVAWWDWFLSALAARTRAPVVRAGVGRAYRGPEGAARSAREAVRALDHAHDSVTHYRDVEISDLLRSLTDGPAFMRARLGPLIDGSPAQRELLDTLRAYLAAGKNAKEAARRLAVHRNTLLYRLRRVQELLDFDWDDSDAVFALDLALRLNALSRVALNSSVDNG